MDVTFMQLSDRDDEELVKFLTTNSFPFHRITAPSEELVRQLIVDGRFDADGVCTYWVFGDNQRLGLVLLERLDSECPIFDLRLVEEARGQGSGVPVLRALTGLVFTERPETHRFAGRTREDNIAMRKTFLRSGFLKEAHYREDWPLEDGRWIASVTYAVLRRDWELGTVTEFSWRDVEQP